MLTTNKLEYIAFKDENGVLIAEAKTLKYIAGDSYNIEYIIDVFNPKDYHIQNSMGTLMIVNSNYMLKELLHKNDVTEDSTNGGYSNLL